MTRRVGWWLSSVVVTVLVAAVLLPIAARSASAEAAFSAGYRLGGVDVAPLAGYRLPLAGATVVVRPFSAPPTPYSAGHRGVDLAASGAELVLAAANGRVRFAGQLAGRGVIVIEHADGVSTEYEPVEPVVAVGTAVRRGQPIGRLRGQHHACRVDSCLHWGARRNGIYLDPLRLLRPLGPVRLLPWRQARGWARTYV
ncbi:MAG: M23 family metallopeptidase [Actinomycetota bacterium]